MDSSGHRRKRVRALLSGAEARTVSETTLNTAQSIARDLREQILSGALAPGSRVTQRDLAMQFGRSPMAARDAVKILLAEGLVVQEGAKTIVVAPISLQDFREIMELRWLMEPRALELAIPRVSTEDLAAMHAALALSGTTDDPRQFVANHWSFHQALYRPAGVARLLSLIDQQHNLLVRYLMPGWGKYGVMVEWAGGEAELAMLVEQRRAAEAAEWLRRDLAEVTQRVLLTMRWGA